MGNSIGTVQAQRSTGSWVRFATVIVASLFAMAMLAGGAQANDATMSGHKTCSSGSPYSWLQYRTSGSGWVNPPGSSTAYFFYHLDGYETGHQQGVLYGGGWYVEASIGINGEQTYGYCTSWG